MYLGRVIFRMGALIDKRGLYLEGVGLSRERSDDVQSYFLVIIAPPSFN